MIALVTAVTPTQLLVVSVIATVAVFMAVAVLYYCISLHAIIDKVNASHRARQIVIHKLIGALADQFPLDEDITPEEIQRRRRLMHEITDNRIRALEESMAERLKRSPGKMPLTPSAEMDAGHQQIDPPKRRNRKGCK